VREVRFATGSLARVGGGPRLDAPLRIIAAITLFATSIMVVSVRAEAPAFAARTPGELVRYDFREGGGDTVFDVSGVGVALDLTIGDVGAVSWVSGGGLSVDAATVVSSGGPASKVIDAVVASIGDEHHDGTQIIDIDNDGDKDIVSVGWSNSLVLLYMNGAA